jgi:hypothetical protein
MRSSPVDTQICDAKEFAMSFACAVTATTEIEETCIAKNGDESLFELMRRIFPQVSNDKPTQYLRLFEIRHMSITKFVNKS